MPAFSQKPFLSTEELDSAGAKYRRILTKRPFLSFGLPFVITIVAGSFFLTPATAVRYERYDRKNHALNRHEAADIEKLRAAKGGRSLKNIDLREEYFKLAGDPERMAALDKWEPIRVKRLSGEPDGTFD